ncbi:ParB/RepB/Spo0J family partition protein [Novosphingobium sp. P6W]|uniref:ParB/RepB/Spo0J family partition protein n=1 Tax=Novosphingobium sp. P6W TaxID=1609758 RepID=UPI0009E5FDE1|nr:ParB/RepB/Spo0J family partition protein [Novosphingobium sp. P6W]AXB76608.1 ParB/RepB/Spo0J family partition protein [Novosphingobium sp. P6W]
MKLDFLPLDKLTVSRINMRARGKAPDVTDILPSIRARGVLVPLIVRPAPEGDFYEIVAGLRRYTAAALVAQENGGTNPLPAAIIDPGDDAAALEASLLENIARLAPDEVTQWETFARLVREGRKLEDIAATFGLPESMVRRVLALGNLMPRIRDLYRREKIDAATVRHLTMATKQRQRDWLTLFADPDRRAPTGHQLKAWLCGGASIPTTAALFDLATYPGQVLTTLFGDEAYFADPEQFWTAQMAAVEDRAGACREAGWSEVVVVPRNEPFHAWEYEKVAKRKGGRVYIDVRSSGEVTVHEGYLSRREARRAEQSEIGDAKPARPEITAGMQTYIDLHRHAAVRAELLGHPMMALRLMLAHAIAGSPQWSIRPDPRTARHEETMESAEGSRAEAVFDAARRDALSLLESPPGEPTLVGGAGDHGLASLFARLLALADEAVLGLVPLVMGETLMTGSAAVEAVGTTLGVDMADWWEADPAFFSLLRDREVLTRMVAEVAGETVAQANAAEKTATLKIIIDAHLQGADGRARVERWVPRWMRFGPGAYTDRGGVGTVKAAHKVEAARAALIGATASGEDGTGEENRARPSPHADGEEPLAA